MPMLTGVEWCFLNLMFGVQCAMFGICCLVFGVFVDCWCMGSWRGFIYTFRGLRSKQSFSIMNKSHCSVWSLGFVQPNNHFVQLHLVLLQLNRFLSKIWYSVLSLHYPLRVRSKKEPYRVKSNKINQWAEPTISHTAVCTYIP